LEDPEGFGVVAGVYGGVVVAHGLCRFEGTMDLEENKKKKEMS
jgi:hypothetical protein